eukprot:GHVN01019741.1.p1 GENE.GHVN01019741.1~~GHVN01019741.1.p1  ORF type:complete len:125 (-),score=14.91 GHVN01019741.1:271-645(-)
MQEPSEMPPWWQSRTAKSIYSEMLVHSALKTQGHVSVGAKGIDGLLGGGFARGELSEVSGAAGSGKTQLLLSFTAEVSINTRYVDSGHIQTLLKMICNQHSSTVAGFDDAESSGDEGVPSEVRA